MCADGLKAWAGAALDFVVVQGGGVVAGDDEDQSIWIIGVGDEEEIFGIGGQSKCCLWLGECGCPVGGFIE